MSTQSARFAGDAQLTAAHTSGEKIYFRSTSADDDGVFNIFGDQSSIPELEAVDLGGLSNGIVGGITTGTFENLKLIESVSALVGTLSIYSNDGTPDTGGIHVHSKPSDGDTITIGLTGLTEVITFKTTVVSSGQVKIGADTLETADNLASYLMDTSTGTSTPVDGTDWNASAANAYLTATVSGGNLNLTSKISGAMGLSWVITPFVPADLTVTNMSGGVDGTLLGTITSADYSASPANGGLIMSTGDLSTETLPPGLDAASVAVQVGGRFAVNYRSGTLASNTSTAYVQVSNDGETWWSVTDGATVDLTTDLTSYQSGDGLFAEYARILINTSASNTASLEMDIVFVY